MQKAKVDLLMAFFSYSGNGGCKTVAAQIVPWWAKTYHGMCSDERIGRIGYMDPGDVPLTMERNRVVAEAKDSGYDLIWMIDSDNIPDLYLGADPQAKPFWESSFDFIYGRMLQGRPTVVVAPYCGPPPHPVTGGYENVYVFYFEQLDETNPANFRIEGYDRTTAAAMAGIVPCASGPTGCTIYTTDAFDLMPIGDKSQRELLDEHVKGELPADRAITLMNMDSWFFYEFQDQRRTKKASTEDCTNTREITLAGLTKTGEYTVFCNWDAWAGHVKPKVVGKPPLLRADRISRQYREAVERGIVTGESLVDVDFSRNAPPAPPPPAPRETAAQDNGDQSGNGLYRATRSVLGRAVRVVGHETPLEELELLSQIVAIHAQSHSEKPLRIIEVGSWVGESAIALASGLGEQGGEVYCVDHFKGSATDLTRQLANKVGGSDAVYEYFCENVGDWLGTKIKPIRKSSAVAAKMDPQDADIIFLDAGHTYAEVKADLDRWLPHLADDGLLVGHDAENRFDGVDRAIKEYFLDVGVDVVRPAGTTLWAVYKSHYLAALDALKEEPSDA